MGLFGFGKKEKDKMKDGLEKTRTGFWGNIMNTLTGSKIDDDLYDELEEQLILADVGGEVAIKLVDKLRDRVNEKGLKTGEQASDELRDLIADEMRPEAEMDLSGTPAVILVIGVNGVGKTTTKQMTYAAIAGFGNTIKTEGNQNNELGLPRTMFRIGKETQYAVVEMGMSHAGEIERLSKCARPDVGIITCIGVSHIGNLGSQENICKAKLEICAGLPEGAPLVLNGDDPFLRKAVLPDHVRPVWFSLGDENADVCALSIQQDEKGMSFVLEDHEEGTFLVKIPAMGRHNVANALAAYCAATRLGLNARRVIAGLADFEQTGMRQKVVHVRGVDVIEDCYNANPDSMKAALAMFREYPCKRRFALLGDMLELGDISRAAHEEVGRQAVENKVDYLVTYGEQAKRIAVVAAAKGLPTLHADTYAQAAEALLNKMQPGDALLVKASRGMALEKVLEIFYKE